MAVDVSKRAHNFGGKFLGQFESVNEFPKDVVAGDVAFDWCDEYVFDGREWMKTTTLMVDSVKFRGRSLETGKFVYGYLSKRRNMNERPAYLTYCIDYEENGVMMSALVDPRTISQMAFRDSDGKEVYFDDMVRRSGKEYRVIRGKWGVLLVGAGECLDRGCEFGDVSLIRHE